MTAHPTLVCRACGLDTPGQLGQRCPTDGTVLVPGEILKRYPTDGLLGSIIAEKYAVVGLIGIGGFGSVYHCIQDLVGRDVAVKVIHPGHAGKQTMRQRFFREASSIARLTHPSAVILHDYGAQGSLLYMVLEYVRGQALKPLIEAEAPMHAKRVVQLATQILGALADAHLLGIVHRDLKPQNIMVGTDAFGEERIKVLDFGLAKLLRGSDGIVTKTGQILGTPNYLAPEQCGAGSVDARSDLYSLGVLIYEMLAGQRPFRGRTALDILKAHVRKPVPPMPAALLVPPALEAVVVRALAKRQADRFQDARAMAKALGAAIRHSPLITEPNEVGSCFAEDTAITTEPLPSFPGEATTPQGAPDLQEISDAAPPAEVLASADASWGWPAPPETTAVDGSWGASSDLRGESIQRAPAPVGSRRGYWIAAALVIAGGALAAWLAIVPTAPPSPPSRPPREPVVATIGGAVVPSAPPVLAVERDAAVDATPDAAVDATPATSRSTPKRRRRARPTPSPDAELERGLTLVAGGELERARRIVRRLAERPDGVQQMRQLAAAVRQAERAP